MFGVSLSSALMVETSSSSPIIDNNQRAAKKSAIESALLQAIRSYYESTASTRGGVIPDVTDDYLKYVSNYVVVFTEIANHTYSITVRVNLDTIGLNDAKQISTPATNTAVFSFNGIPDNILPKSKVSEIISSLLTANNFTLSEQKTFDYVTSDMIEDSAMLDAFTDTNSKHYFQFIFNISFINLKNPSSRCELTTYTTLNKKAGKGSTLKLETSSNLTNPTSCIEETLITSIGSTIDYIRGNLIKTKTIDNNEIHSITIKATNFDSMVDVNNFMTALKNRGYISQYKTVSFAPKNVTLIAESNLDIESLNNKMPAINTDFKLQIKIDSDTLLVDFSKR